MVFVGVDSACRAMGGSRLGESWAGEAVLPLSGLLGAGRLLRLPMGTWPILCPACALHAALCRSASGR